MAHYNHFAVFKKIDEQMKGEKRPAEVSRRLAFGIEGQEQKMQFPEALILLVV